MWSSIDWVNTINSSAVVPGIGRGKATYAVAQFGFFPDVSIARFIGALFARSNLDNQLVGFTAS